MGDNETITFALEWTHTPASFQRSSVREVARLLEIARYRSEHPHWIEVLSNDCETRAYYDIDQERRDGETEDSILEDAKLRLREQGMTDIISICSSHGTKKISYHIVCGYRGKRADWQAIARTCNLRNGTALFDLKVYNRNQKFRLPYCTKPVGTIRNCDPEQRIKTPIYGGILDAFLTYIPAGTPPWIRGADPTEEITESNEIKWLKLTLDHPPFQSFWKKKADDYPSWVQMGLSIRFEYGETYAERGFELFKKFSMISSKYDPSETREKYDGAFRNARQSHIASLRAYLMRSNPDEARKFEAVFRGRTPTESSFISSADEPMELTEQVDMPEIPDYLPVFSFHYRIIQHIKEPVFFAFWRNQITAIADLKKVLTLMRYMTEEEAYMFGKRDEKTPYHDQAANGQYWGRRKALEISFGLHALQPYRRDITVARAEEFALKFLKDLFNLEGELPSEWFTNEENPDEIYKAYNVYRKTLARIDQGLLEAFDIELQAGLLFPLRGFEQPSPVDRLNWCLRNCHNIKWETQVPYLSFFQFIADEIPDLNTPLNKILFSHYTSRLTAEPVFNFFGNSFTERIAAKTIQSLYPFWLTSPDNILYVYDDHTGKYTCSEDDHHRIIARFSVLLTERRVTSYSYNGESYAGKVTILKELRTLDENRPSAGFFRNLRLTTSGKLLFPNGIYDGNSGVFTSCVKKTYVDKPLFVWPEMHFFGRVPDPYLETITPEDSADMDDLYRDMFVNMHGPEIAAIRVESIALAAFRIPMKRFYVELGPTDAGKSTEIDLLKATFGEMVGTSNLNKLRHLKDDKTDPSLKLDFVYQNWWKAILMFSEASDITLDADILKSIASGGSDDVTCRIQHKQDVTVPVVFTMFMYLNNPIKVNKEDAAFLNRINYHVWGKRYVPTVVNPTLEIQAIPKEQIEALIGSRRHRQLYLQIFIRAFTQFVARGKKVLEKPAHMLAENPVGVANMQNGEEILEQLMFRFEFNGRANSYVPVTEMDEAMKEVTSGTDQQHYKKLLCNAIDSYMLPLGVQRTIYKKQKKLAGKNVLVWIGVERRASIMGETQILTDYQQWKTAMELHRGVITDEVLGKMKEAAYLCTLTRELTENEKNTTETYATQDQLKHLFAINPYVRN